MIIFSPTAIKANNLFLLQTLNCMGPNKFLVFIRDIKILDYIQTNLLTIFNLIL